MNNVVYSILPFILFGFICAVLTRRRFSKKVTTAVWIAVMAVLAGVHLGVGLASYDSSVIIALMPVTAYLPVIIALFILSRRSLSGNIFVVSVALLADVIAALVRKLCIVYVFGYIAGGVWASVLCAAIVAAVCVVIGFVVFRFLRIIFRGGNIVENNSWFILFVTLLPVVLSLYRLASVADVTGTILLLYADVCVFAVTVAYIVVANALENSINACADVARGAASIEVVADCSSGKFAFFIGNSVASAISLGEDGLPLSEKTEEHGYGMSSIRYIVEKYSGMLECKSTDDRFSVRLVLFSAEGERPSGPKKRRVARAYPDMTKDEYVEEMLCLFKEAGLFLTRIQLEKLLALRRRGSSPITKTK